MSDHVWVQENVAAYLAGGLDAREAERLEAHTRDCEECATLLVDARCLDGKLNVLFTGVKPDFGLEDRAVARLRAGPSRTWQAWKRPAKWAGAIAAVLVLGVIGAIAERGLLSDAMSSPVKNLKASEGGGLAAEPRKGGRVPITPPLRDGYLINEDLGLDSHLEAALPEIDRLDQRSVEVATTADPIGQPIVPIDDSHSLTPWAFHGRSGMSKSPVPPTATASYIIGQSGGTKSSFAPSPFDPGKLRPTISSSAPKGFDPTSSPVSTPPAPNPGGPPPVGMNPQPKDPDTASNPETARRIILRSGEMEYEIESFDAATATVTKLVLAIKGAFVATVNSDKLVNGKVKGSITVRVPPDQLDGLVLDLRRELGKGGELKGVKLTSQDITKMYADLESRLRAARTMETRLLQIIKEGKGEIKQLLEAERELGVWRTKVEELEGEIRYYSNLAAFSALTITLTEKEIRAAAAITERERVQAGVEVEDVDKAYQDMLKAVVDAKGRITKSEMKQLSAGQFNATFVFEVGAEASGPLRDRLRMLGRVVRLEIDRTVQTEGGTLPSDAKTKRGDTLFLVQLYNLADVAPRETATLQVAATDVPAAYQSLRDAVAKTTGRVLVAQLNEQDRQNIFAVLEFEVRRSEEGAIRAALGAAGEVVSRQVTRAAESDSVTDSKVQYKVTILDASKLKPRQMTTLSVEVQDVDATAALFAARIAEAKGRQIDAKTTRDAEGKATAQFVFEVPLAAAAGLVEQFKSAGKVRVSQSVRDLHATNGKYATARIHVTLTNVEAIVPEGTGLWPKVRQGLSISASVLLTSVTWLVFGLCVVLPWALLGFGGYRVVRRFVAPASASPRTPPSTPQPPAAEPPPAPSA